MTVTDATPSPPPTSPSDVVDVLPRSVRLAAAWSWRILVILLGLAALAAALAVGKVIWVPVVIATLLTVLLNPVVDLMVRRLRMWRGAASAITVVALILLVVGLLTVAGNQIVKGFGDLWGQAGVGLDQLAAYLADGPLGLDRAQIDAYIAEGTGQLQSNSGSLVSGALSITATLGHVAAGIVITLFTLLFFLKDGPLVWAWVVRLLPAGARPRMHEAGRRGAVTLAAFTRTQILVALIDAIGIGVGAAILGIPLAVPLAVLVFLASFIPFVGALATGAIAVLVALVDQGVGKALIMLAIVLAVQQIEGHILQPLLLGHAVSLHPVAVLLSVTAGSLSAGIVGALLAVPFVATLNTVVLYLHGRDKFPELGTDTAGFERMRRTLDGPAAPTGAPPVEDAADGRGTSAGAGGGAR